MKIAKNIIKKCLYYALLSPIIKRTNWYNNLFIENTYPNNNWYRIHNERNFDLVLIGSSSAKWAFDFTGIKAMNWAQAPQTLTEGYNLLRNFHSILKKNGIVLISIMPFTSLNKKTNLYDALKYLKIGAQEPIQPFLYQRAKLYSEIPMLLGKPAFKALIKHILKIDKTPLSNKSPYQQSNSMSFEQLEANAVKFINGWKRQFDIIDFNAPLSSKNKEGRRFRIELMRQIIDFCTERNYKPIYIILPVTQHLNQYFTPTFKETYIYSFLEEVNRNIPILDYSTNQLFQRDELYFNSFFFNQKGRELFTHEILNQLINTENLQQL